jgi:hypothetical protein
MLILGLADSTSAGTTPVGTVLEVMLAAPGTMPGSVRCVTSDELRRRTGRRDWWGVTLGSTGLGSTVLLDMKRVCRPLHRRRTGRRLDGRSPEFYELVNALALVMHEKAHVQGVAAEWQAECWGIRPTLNQLRRLGYTNADVLAEVKYYLALWLDVERDEEYKLYGRCRV